MRLADVERIQELASDRLECRRQMESILTSKGRNGWLGVTFHGQYQDESILAIVRPVVVAELRKRVMRIETELLELGVTLEG